MGTDTPNQPQQTPDAQQPPGPILHEIPANEGDQAAIDRAITALTVPQSGGKSLLQQTIEQKAHSGFTLAQSKDEGNFQYNDDNTVTLSVKRENGLEARVNVDKEGHQITAPVVVAPSFDALTPDQQNKIAAQTAKEAADPDKPMDQRVVLGSHEQHAEKDKDVKGSSEKDNDWLGSIGNMLGGGIGKFVTLMMAMLMGGSNFISGLFGGHDDTQNAGNQGQGDQQAGQGQGQQTAQNQDPAKSQGQDHDRGQNPNAGQGQASDIQAAWKKASPDAQSEALSKAFAKSANPDIGALGESLKNSNVTMSDAGHNPSSQPALPRGQSQAPGAQVG